MTARFYYRDDEGDIVELTNTDRILREGWEVTENAEEGATAMSSLVIVDNSFDFDLVGHRQFRVLEDSSEADDDVLWFGFAADQEIGRVAGEVVEPVGRAWTLSLVDGNSLWARRVMVGSDCKRPAESDVERMEWLVATQEMGYFEDLTLLSAGSPVQMDKVDYRGQMVQQVADDCAQQSGKNWWIGMRSTDGGTTHDKFVWYGHASLSTYASTLSLSNDPADWDDAELLDGTSLVWPISFDTKLRRDPSRVYSGVYLPYDGGAVFRQSADTVAQFALSGRDMVAPAVNVKTKAKAVARAIRYLNDLDEQDERITTTVELPAAKATMLRAGMRVPFKATHLPGYETSVDCRVLSCSVSPAAAGNRYRLGLELEPVGASSSGSCSTIIAAGETSDTNNVGGASPSDSITPASDTVLIAWLIGNDNDTPSATNMTAIAGGYTEIFDMPANSRSTWRIATKEATGGVLSTASATFTPGFGGGQWLALHVSLAMSSGTPVQTVDGNGYQGTLPGAPTVGNIVLVFAYSDGAASLGPNADEEGGPTTGWTQLYQRFELNGNASLCAAVFARCVQSGETGLYAFAPASGYTTSHGISIAEFAP